MKKHTVYIGIDDKASIDPDSDFSGYFLDEWLNDPLVKEMVLDIDRSKVLSPYCIQSPILGQIAPEYISGGVKALILLLKVPDYYVDIMVCGENCVKWFKEIAKHQELHIALSTFDLDYIDVEIECENDGTLITSTKTWFDCCSKFMRCRR